MGKGEKIECAWPVSAASSMFSACPLSRSGHSRSSFRVAVALRSACSTALPWERGFSVFVAEKRFSGVGMPLLGVCEAAFEDF